MLLACWHLARLGIYDVKSISLNKKDFKAKEIITIIPKKYSDVELNALEIIKQTKHKKLIDKMHYFLF